ncbi:MAG: 23S rRNA (pseudouridine(1915)-N(3))-methyltransferase RlmH [Coriobacteriales bacterium]|nr:23S rRNA (pseudouridine(1915)-N(3))-methyltransferase RlmH [Coriobacteriales bacterium]
MTAGLHITVVAVGRLKEDYWVSACAEYAKRLSRYATLNVTEVPDRGSRSPSDIGLLLRTEASRLRQRLNRASHVILLDREGRQFSSGQIAALLGKLRDEGVRDLSFVIGGSWGFDEALKQEADLLLSFGPITLPHNLARVVLLEQIYRGFRILKGEPYHK